MSGEAEAVDRPERILGRVSTGRAGPTVVVSAGVHGNEPSGVEALRRVLAGLQGLPLRGTVLGLVGNRAALARGVRFIERDLNRKWEPHQLDRLRQAGCGALSAEDREQAELTAFLDDLHNAARDPIVFLDLHSTSAKGSPFCLMSDALRNRPVALGLPMPLILGLEEVIDGTMLGWLSDLGHITIAIEGGQHDDPHTAGNLEAAIMCGLVAAGALLRDELPTYDAYVQRLNTATAAIPRVVEILHRHVITPDDAFRMEPGFAGFDRIRRGQLLAHDRDGEVRSDWTGRILMPLYQGQGEDGFFVARDVAYFWLRVSAALRHLRLDRLLHWLPGVRRDREDRDILLVNPRIARFLAMQVFHLFGYRRLRPRGHRMAFTRRRPDHRRLAEPTRVLPRPRANP